MPEGQCVPKGVCVPGDCACLGGMHTWGCVCPGGRHAQGVCVYPVGISHACPPPPDRILSTTCENITFPQLLLRAVINRDIFVFAFDFNKS